MDAIALSTVTMPRAAAAAGWTVRALRAFMGAPTRPALLGQPSRAAWHRNRFAPVDVVRLAVARHLLDYGFSPAEASHALDRDLDHHLCGLARCGIDLPASLLLTRLDGFTLRVTRDGAASGPAALHLDIGTIARDALGRLAAPHPSTTAACAANNRTAA